MFNAYNVCIGFLKVFGNDFDHLARSLNFYTVHSPVFMQDQRLHIL